MIYSCHDERRRQAVSALKETGINGIDFLDVVDTHTLQVSLIHPLKADALDKEHVSIEGGERIRDVAVTSVDISGGRVLSVKVNKPGDYAMYTLRLNPDARRLKLDPLLRAVSFTFTSPENFDCQAEAALPAVASTPVIDYLVKDYTSFRQLMLDRLSALLPGWRAQSEADVGVMLVEILAYVADHLSYQQDVIATESYMSTARRRISVRRHARLLDYFVGEGCNARLWVQVRVSSDIGRRHTDEQHADKSHSGKEVALPKGTKLLTRVFGEQKIFVTEDWAWDQLQSAQTEVFETMYDVDGLFVDMNEIYFYTWGARECYLPQGATSATLYGACKHLQVGDVLILKEVLGAGTGSPDDADPTRRQAVRLTKVTHDTDPLGAWFTVEGGKEFLEEEEALPDEEEDKQAHKHKKSEPNYSLDITHIEWHYQDALLFPLCISAMIPDSQSNGETDLRYCDRISVALGNIVLADHGCTINEHAVAIVPQNEGTASLLVGEDDLAISFPRFSPCLTYTPLTHVDVNNNGRDKTTSASVSGQLPTHEGRPPTTLPAITLNSRHGGGPVRSVWHPQLDLLSSKPTDRQFVVEIDDSGKAYLRFGDNTHGLRPAAGTEFSATYRVGNGMQGNIGRETLYHIALKNNRITKVDNPMPASGGIDPQSIDDVRQSISQTFSTQERGVRPEDYKEIAERDPEVERANAILRWTGSRYTVFLTVERVGGAPVDDVFRYALRKRMERFRMAGADLVIVAPVFVSLEIEMEVQIQATFIATKVKAALMEVFSNRRWPDGQQGIFYQGSYSFGTPVYLSDLYSAAYAIVGVQAVTITKFQRQGIPGSSGLEDGVLEMDWLEIARMENDPSAPSHGVFGVITRGGVI